MAFQRAKALASAQGLSLLSSCWGAGERPSSALTCFAVLPGALSFTFFMPVAGGEALYPDLHTLSHCPLLAPPNTLQLLQSIMLWANWVVDGGWVPPHPPCSAPAGIQVSLTPKPRASGHAKTLVDTSVVIILKRTVVGSQGSLETHWLGCGES